MVVQHNLSAMNANRYLGINNSKLSKSLEKLSSGYAINRAGDNAAGLAVSEKMRSQIAGMTQAVKNAQDGISMVQTFEGALTETDSILQRMKTLANQMANGSYDDPVDRTAAQQEFLQLNDELDQIADTDFNGVVVLNGGKMSDGTMANGISVSVDSETGLTKKTYDTTAEKAGLIDYRNPNVDDTAAKEKAALEKQLAEIKDPKAITVTDIDEIKYNKAAADKLWEDLGITTDDADAVTITFTAQADGTFKATAATAEKDGKEVDADVKFSNVTAAAAANGKGTGEGGVNVSGATAGQVSNVIFDGTDINAGDVFAVKFTNTADKTYAPKNIGFGDDSMNELDGKYSYKGDATIKLADGLTDNTMNDDWKTVLDNLSAATIDFTVTATGTAGSDVTATAKAATAISDTTNFTYTAATGKITLAKAVGGLAVGTEVGTVTFDSQIKELAGQTAAATTKGSMKIAIENYSAADPTKVPDASVATAKPDTSATDAQKKEIEDQIKDLEYKVSKSDAFKNSETQMTYKDSITLQVGARTKDAVNFTFQYKSTAIGDLTADLDCTAAGLGTNILNLNTQKDANFAVDKIDQAINKVSLVRGTFGAIQNRLEHKIDNLNVSVENLTSAESQIRDTNMPQEMMNFTKQQILAQASQSMLAQANQLPQGVLSLLQ